MAKAYERLDDERDERERLRRRTRKVLKPIQNAAPKAVEETGGLGLLRRTSALMKGLGLCEIHDTPSGLTDALGQIEIFEVHKKSLVEPTNGHEDDTRHEIESTDHVIDLARAIVVPLVHEVSVEVRRDQLVEPKYCHSDVSRQERARRRASGLSFFVHEPDADDSDVSVRYHDAGGAIEGVRIDPSIRIEKEKKVRRGPGGPLVARCRKPRIGVVADHLNGKARSVRGSRGSRPVRGRIVHDHDTGKRNGLPPQMGKRRKAFCKLVSNVPAYDDDVYCWEGLRQCR